MSFSPKIVEEALISCGRHCCLCHKFCGTKIELHHIIQRKNGGDDSLDNCLPLCFDCHADVMQYNPEHPKGKKYNPSELKRHREIWYDKVKLSSGVSHKNSSYLKIDKKTYDRLTTLLKSDGLMYFIRNNLFIGGPFSYDIIEQIYLFRMECELPEFEFIDSDLESLKVELKVLFDKLDELTSKNIFGAGGVDRMSIPYEWEELDPKRLSTAISDFDNLTKHMSKVYDNFIKLSRRKLFKD